MNRGHAHEGYQQAERFLARPEAAAPNHLRAKALHTAGALAYYQGRFLAAKPWFVEGIAVSRSLGPGGKYHLALSLSVQGYCSMGLNDFEAMEIVAREILGLGYELHDAWIQGHAFNQLGIVELHQGNYTNAGEYFLESFGCFQKDGQSIMRGSALRLVGVTMIEVGDYVKAQKYLYQSLAVFEQLEDKGRCSRTLRQLSMLTLAQGHFAEAEDLLTQALKLGRQVANTRDYVLTLDAIGRLAQKQGNYKRAYNLLSESIVLGTELEHQDSVAYSLEAFASLAVTQGEPDKATTLLSAAVAFLPAIEARKLGLNMMYGLTTEDNHDYLVARCRESLDETAFAATWAKGAAMTLDQAVAYALETTPTLVAPNGP
jgi:tetratricopeptide (TPR) repeat protein